MLLGMSNNPSCAQRRRPPTRIRDSVAIYRQAYIGLLKSGPYWPPTCAAGGCAFNAFFDSLHLHTALAATWLVITPRCMLFLALTQHFAAIVYGFEKDVSLITRDIRDLIGHLERLFGRDDCRSRTLDQKRLTWRRQTKDFACQRGA